MLKPFLRILLIIIVGGIVFFLLVQLVPYGKDHTNPPVVNEPVWDSPQTRALAKRACFDCHSNETVWPWYSNIAPASWLIYRDVVEGRRKFNLSDWQSASLSDVGEVAEVISEGEMPPLQYLPLHPEATLSQPEKLQLIDGLRATLGR